MIRTLCGSSLLVCCVTCSVVCIEYEDFLFVLQESSG